MGNSLEAWRCRIGCFNMPRTRIKFRCPKLTIIVSSLIRLSLVASLLLVVSGVETNTGPRTKATVYAIETEPDDIKSLLSSPQNPMTTEMKNIRKDITDMRGSIGLKQTELENKMVEHIAELKSEFNDKYEQLSENIDQLTAENSSLREKVCKLDDQSRRDNLIFWGIPESDGIETWDDCESKIRSTLTDTIGIEDANDERAHRLGARTPRKPKGLIVKFTRWKQKQTILTKARAMDQDTDIRVSDDLSASVRDKRKNLWTKAAKLFEDNPNERVHLRHDRIVMGNRTFVWDQRKKCAVELKKGQRP